MIERLDITDIGTGGDGIARDADGRAVFVPLTAPGDVVEVEVDTDGRGKMIRLVTPSPLRADPPCPHFGVCGGCALQHLNVETYQKFKRDSVLSVLQKAGIDLPEKAETIFIPDHTRRRANFAVRIVKGKAVIGFHERKSATIRDVPDCLLIRDDVRRIINGMRDYLPAIAGDGQKMDVLVQCIDGQAEVALTGKIAPGWEAQQALSDTLRTLDLARISLRARDYETYEILLNAKGFIKAFDSLLVNLAPGAFLQPSDEGERTLRDCVIKGAGDASCIADLFCGNGTFTGPLMKGGRVTGYDSAADAIEGLRKAGAKAHVRNLFKDPLPADELSAFDVVVLDPPRAGAAAQVAEIGWARVPRVIYVSCNPQSFARDAGVLQGAGYRLAALTIVDQFIWSAHTELAAVFTLT